MVKKMTRRIALACAIYNIDACRRNERGVKVTMCVLRLSIMFYFVCFLTSPAWRILGGIKVVFILILGGKGVRKGSKKEEGRVDRYYVCV